VAKPEIREQLSPSLQICPDSGSCLPSAVIQCSMHSGFHGMVDKCRYAWGNSMQLLMHTSGSGHPCVPSLAIGFLAESIGGNVTRLFETQRRVSSSLFLDSFSSPSTTTYLPRCLAHSFSLFPVLFNLRALLTIHCLPYQISSLPHIRPPRARDITSAR
jgi:hypothetical protein